MNLIQKLKSSKKKRELLYLIRKDDDLALHTVCSFVEQSDDLSFLQTMKKVCRATKNGVGLAAPQIGITKQAIFVDPPNSTCFFMINPSIMEHDDKKVIGEEDFQQLRRAWDFPVPHGESLKMVYERTVPFFLNKILPLLKEGKNVLVVAHGNSLRAVIKYIENVKDENANDLEMPFGGVLFYDLDNDGHMIHKETKMI